MMGGLWQSKMPLVLASKSAARRALLSAAKIPFETIDVELDEREVEAPLRNANASASEIAAQLARAKARQGSALCPDRLVLGADQTLSFDGKVLIKPATLAQAHQQLADFSGRTHELKSAACMMRNGDILFETVATAKLTCRNFDDDFINRYIEATGTAVLESVGAYQIEALGIHLFARIEGDHATILGLPLLPLLAFLREDGSLIG